MWLKIIFISMIMILMIGFTADAITVYYVYESTGRAMEHALDAGIVKSGYVLDGQQGYIQLDEARLKPTVKSEFARYLGLDGNLEGNVMSDSNFQLKLSYDSSGVPWIHTELSTHVTFAMGIDYPLQVNRRIEFESIYK